MKKMEGEEGKHRDNFTRRHGKLLNRENTMRKSHSAKERAAKRENGGYMGRYMGDFRTHGKLEVAGVLATFTPTPM